MEPSTFVRWQMVIILLFQWPHIALILLRYLAQVNQHFLWQLTQSQYEFIKFSDDVLILFYIKFGIYGFFFLSWFCCCCCIFKAGLHFHRCLFCLDFLIGLYLAIKMSVDEFDSSYVDENNKVYKFEIGFMVGLAIMTFVDLMALKLYKRGLDEGLYFKTEEDSRLESSVHSPYYQGPRRYGSYDPPPAYSYKQSPVTYTRPSAINARRTTAPTDIRIRGVEQASAVFTDGRGGYILVMKTLGATVSAMPRGTVRAQGITETKVAWISAEAIRRNPSNPDVYVMTEMEVSQINFGSETENIRRALNN